MQPYTTASNSLSMFVYLFSASISDRESKQMGLLSCMGTAPIPIPEASAYELLAYQYQNTIDSSILIELYLFIILYSSFLCSSSVHINEVSLYVNFLRCVSSSVILYMNGAIHVSMTSILPTYFMFVGVGSFLYMRFYLCLVGFLNWSRLLQKKVFLMLR